MLDVSKIQNFQTKKCQHFKSAEITYLMCEKFPIKYKASIFFHQFWWFIHTNEGSNLEKKVDNKDFSGFSPEAISNRGENIFAISWLSNPIWGKCDDTKIHK